MKVYQKIRYMVFLGLFLVLFAWLWKKQNWTVADLIALDKRIVLSWIVWIGLIWLLNTFKLLVLLKAQNKKLSFVNGYEVTAAAGLLNYLPLQSGTAFRGAYLAKKLQLPVRQYLSLLAGTYVIMLLVQNMLGFFFVLTGPKNQYTVPLVGTFVILFLIALALAILPISRLCQKLERFRVVRWISDVHQNFQLILKNPLCFVALVLAELGVFMVDVIKIKLAFELVGIGNIPLASLGVIASLGLQSYLLNLTPAGLGMRESVMALAAVTYSFQFNQALLAASLDRVLMLIVIFCLAPFLTLRSFKTINFFSKN